MLFVRSNQFPLHFGIAPQLDQQFRFVRIEIGITIDGTVAFRFIGIEDSILGYPRVSGLPFTLQTRTLLGTAHVAE